MISILSSLAGSCEVNRSILRDQESVETIVTHGDLDNVDRRRS